MVDYPIVMPVPPELGDPRYNVYLDLRDLVMVAYRHSVGKPDMLPVVRFIEKNYSDYLATCSELELRPARPGRPLSSNAALLT
jgi:hypothetical protein